jgi:hypothetical protein
VCSSLICSPLRSFCTVRPFSALLETQPWWAEAEGAAAMMGAWLFWRNFGGVALYVLRVSRFAGAAPWGRVRRHLHGVCLCPETVMGQVCAQCGALEGGTHCGEERQICCQSRGSGRPWWLVSVSEALDGPASNCVLRGDTVASSSSMECGGYAESRFLEECRGRWTSLGNVRGICDVVHGVSTCCSTSPRRLW